MIWGTAGLASLTSVSGKVMAQLTLETISKLVKDKNMTGSCQYGFTKRKPCLTSLIAFCDVMILLVGKGRAVEVFHLYF